MTRRIDLAASRLTRASLLGPLCLVALTGCGETIVITPEDDPAAVEVPEIDQRPRLNPRMQADWFVHFPGDVGNQIAFSLQVQQYVFDRGYAVSLDDDGDLQLPTLGTELDIAPLAKLCAEVGGEGWRDVFDEHLGSWFDRLSSLENWTVPSWEAAKPLLHLKFFTAEVFRETGQDASTTIATSEIDGLWTAVVFDQELAEVTVPRPVLEMWERPERSVMVTAEEQTRARLVGNAITLESRPVEGYDELQISSLAGPSASLSARVLEEWPDLVGPGGTLIAIPRTDVLYAVPVNSPKAAYTIAGLRVLAEQNAFGAEALSTSVFWRTEDGEIKAFEFDGEEVTPPEGFTEALK
ncbi:MAG: hypothetical protein AAF196_06825 [Planctomycetota bacterium]